MDNGIYYINDRYHDLFLQLNVFSVIMIHLVTLNKENNIIPSCRPQPVAEVQLKRNVKLFQPIA
jgi:hypothetical protein